MLSVQHQLVSTSGGPPALSREGDIVNWRVGSKPNASLVADMMAQPLVSVGHDMCGEGGGRARSLRVAQSPLAALFTRC